MGTPEHRNERMGTQEPSLKTKQRNLQGDKSYSLKHEDRTRRHGEETGTVSKTGGEGITYG